MRKSGHAAYEDNKPVGLEAVVLSTQHSPEVSTKALRER